MKSNEDENLTVEEAEAKAKAEQILSITEEN